MKRYWLTFIYFIILSIVYIPLHAQDTLLNIKKDSVLHSIGIKYDLTFFEKGQNAPWHLVSTEYIRKQKKLTFVGRINYAHRFGKSAGQIETDAYPLLSRKMYAYLNAGYSPGKTLFPKYRSGISLYYSLPSKFEIETGARYLFFDKPVYIYTASLGKYYKKYWFNLSIFLSPQNSNISSSFFLKSRYYLNDKDFIMLLLGTGLSPDNLVDNTFFNTYLKSKKAEVSYRRTIQQHYIIFVSSSISHQQIQPSHYINQYNISLGFHVEF